MSISYRFIAHRKFLKLGARIISLGLVALSAGTIWPSSALAASPALDAETAKYTACFNNADPTKCTNDIKPEQYYAFLKACKTQPRVELDPQILPPLDAADASVISYVGNLFEYMTSSCETNDSTTGDKIAVPAYQKSFQHIKTIKVIFKDDTGGGHYNQKSFDLSYANGVLTAAMLFDKNTPIGNGNINDSPEKKWFANYDFTK